MYLNNSIEIFLFVSPLGRSCYEKEKMIEDFAQEREEKVRVRFVPLLNFQTIGKLMKEKQKTSLVNRNQLYTDSYHSILGFQSAALQGKKKGRQFLLSLQDKVINERKAINKQLFFEIAETIKLDLEMFKEDLFSDFSKNSFNKDQKLAQEMGINDTPSCVFYCDNDENYGYRIDNSINKQLLHGLCDDKIKAPTKSNSKHLSLLQMM